MSLQRSEAPILRRLTSSGAAYVADFSAYAGPRLILAVGLMVVGAILDGIGIASLIPLLQILLAESAQSVWAARLDDAFAVLGLESQESKVAIFVGAFFVLIIVRGLFQVWQQMILFDLNIGFCDSVRKRLFGGVLQAPWQVAAGSNYAELRNVILREVGRLGAGTQQFLGSIVALMTLGIQLILAFLVAPGVTTAVVILIGLSYILFDPFFRSALRIGESLGVRGEKMMRSFETALGGLKPVKAANYEVEYYARVSAEIDAVRDLQNQFNLQRLWAAMLYRVGGIAVGCIVLLGGLFVTETPMPILIVLVLILSRLVQPAMSFQQGSQAFANMLPAYESIQSIEKGFVQRAERPKLMVSSSSDWICSVRKPIPSIEMRDVTFSHARSEANTRLLSEFSLTLRPNTMTALVGPSGTGKTTVADLLIGLLEPGTGEILIDGVPLDAAQGPIWRDRTAYIAQEPYLLAGTIAENLEWTTSVADEATQWQALEAAGAADMVRGLPNGLLTEIGESGRMLSGGQRQVVCLARAFLRRPHFIILDEATASVDPKWDSRIFDAVYQWRKHCSILVITHRYTNLDRCDRIVTIHKGRAVELATADLRRAALSA
jgi:ATP-binding cassette, subfamily C, bacterial